MIWRDDDVNAKTRIEVLAAVDDLFQKYGFPHTIAVIVDGFERRADLIKLIRERKMIVQLHCWTHLDLRFEENWTDIERGVNILSGLFGERPTVLYPPWNRESADLNIFARSLGLDVSTRKVSLEQYVRAEGDVAEGTVNFHHWYVPDALLLEPALRIASARRGAAA
jgi:peptidoglycan/xylan/chitin deacetylase (PgdA/CDA1 family)